MSAPHLDAAGNEVSAPHLDAEGRELAPAPHLDAAGNEVAALPPWTPPAFDAETEAMLAADARRRAHDAQTGYFHVPKTRYDSAADPTGGALGSGVAPGAEFIKPGLAVPLAEARRRIEATARHADLADADVASMRADARELETRFAPGTREGGTGGSSGIEGAEEAQLMRAVEQSRREALGIEDPTELRIGKHVGGFLWDALELYSRPVRAVGAAAAVGLSHLGDDAKPLPASLIGEAFTKPDSKGWSEVMRNLHRLGLNPVADMQMVLFPDAGPEERKQILELGYAITGELAAMPADPLRFLKPFGLLREGRAAASAEESARLAELAGKIAEKPPREVFSILSRLPAEKRIFERGEVVGQVRKGQRAGLAARIPFTEKEVDLLAVPIPFAKDETISTLLARPIDWISKGVREGTGDWATGIRSAARMARVNSLLSLDEQDAYLMRYFSGKQQADMARKVEEVWVADAKMLKNESLRYDARRAVDAEGRKLSQRDTLLEVYEDGAPSSLEDRVASAFANKRITKREGQYLIDVRDKMSALLKKEQTAGIEITALQVEDLTYLHRAMTDEAKQAMAKAWPQLSPSQRIEAFMGKVNKLPGFAKERTIRDLTTTEVNAMGRELGLEVDLLHTDLPTVTAARELASVKALGTQGLLKHLGERYGTQLPPGVVEALGKGSATVPAYAERAAKLQTRIAETRFTGEGDDLVAREGLRAAYSELDQVRALDKQKMVIVREGPLAGKAMPVEIAQIAHELTAVQAPKVQNAIWHLYQNYTRWWKTWSLSPRPGFHSRNLVSNLWQNGLAGVYDPRDYAMALRLQSARPNAKIWDEVMELGNGEKRTMRELYDEARSLGADRSEFSLAHDAMRKSVARDLQGRFGGTRLRDASPWSTLRLDAEAQAAAEAENLWLRAGMATGDFIERNARLTHFLAKRRAGQSVEQATLSVRKYLFDYSELSQAERSVRDAAVPFYGWMRNNFALQMGEFARNPEKYTRVYRGVRALEGDRLPDELLPEWSQGQGAVQGKLENGILEVRTLGGYWPGWDLDRARSGDVGSNFTPILSALISQMTGTDLFTKRPVGGWRNPVEGLPDKRTTFLGREMSTTARTWYGRILPVSLTELDAANPGGALGASPKAITEGNRRVDRPGEPPSISLPLPWTEHGEGRDRMDPGGLDRALQYGLGTRKRRLDLSQDAQHKLRALRLAAGERNSAAKKADAAGQPGVAAKYRAQRDAANAEHARLAELYLKHGIPLYPETD